MPDEQGRGVGKEGGKEGGREGGIEGRCIPGQRHRASKCG